MTDRIYESRGDTKTNRYENRSNNMECHSSTDRFEFCSGGTNSIVLTPFYVDKGI